MAGKWAIKPFSEAVLINPSVPLEQGKVYPFVDMQAVDPNSRSVHANQKRVFTGGGSRFAVGDTLMARITPCLENGKITQYADDDTDAIGHGSTEFIVIRGRPEVSDTDFAYYLTRWDNVRQYAIAQMTGTSGRQRVPTESLRHMKVQLPPLSDQRAIASILGALDDKIELNRRMNETLEAMARAVFKSWFVDFDPIPGHGPHKEWQDSPLGRIPKGWRVKPLSEITTVITKGTTPTQKDMTSAPDTDAQINYVRVNCIEEDGSIIFDKLTKIPLFVHTGVLKRSILRANDVLYTIAGTIGRIAAAEDWILPANTNQAVAIIRPKPTIPSSFLILTMRHKVFREYLHNNIVHAVQANLSLGMLSKARVIVPPEDLLPKMFMPIGDIMSRISANRKQSRTLAALRDALLPKLLSGEIMIRDAERFAGRHV